MIRLSETNSPKLLIHGFRWFNKATKRKLAWLCLVGFSAAMSGCSFYVMRAAYEEGKILWRREPISDYLTRPELNPDTRAKLRLVLAVRDYARDVIKLNRGGSYSSYSFVDTRDLTSIVMAGPQNRLSA